MVAPQPVEVDRAGLRIMGDRIRRIMVGEIGAVDDVRAAAMDRQRAVAAELDEGREAPAAAARGRQPH